MGALDGLKIADFSWVGAGPRATKDLADNGATVVKVESARRLDLGRMSPPFAGGAKGPDASAFFAQTNTSKKSVTINLSRPEGVAVALKLVAWADVVVENFGPGYMERIGLGYETLKLVRPGIILVSVSVAGRTGPRAGFRGYGNSAAAFSGHAAMTGWPGSEPHMPPYAYGDVVAPMFATVATLAALEYRARTGKGQHVDVSQAEPMVHVIADLFAANAHEKSGNDDPLMVPHGVFACAGEGRWIAVAVDSDAAFQALAGVLGAAGLATDPRFATERARRQNRAVLDATLAPLFAVRDRFELVEKLCAAGVSAGVATDGRDLCEDAELKAAGHFETLDHPVLGPSLMPAPPMRLARTPWKMTRAPLLGEHNREVFQDLLGMSGEEIDQLQKEDILA